MIVALIVLVYTVVCLLKGKTWIATLGLFLPVLAWVGAVRLAEPDSPWAHWFYDVRKLARSRKRAESARILSAHRRRRIRDLVLGAPHRSQRLSSRLTISRSVGYASAAADGRRFQARGDAMSSRSHPLFLASVLAAALAAPAAADAGTWTYLFDCAGGRTASPRSFVLTCADANQASSGMSWRGWDSARATGTGWGRVTPVSRVAPRARRAATGSAQWWIAGRTPATSPSTGASR